LVGHDPETWVSGPGIERHLHRLPAGLNLVEPGLRTPQSESLLRIGLARYRMGEQDDVWSLEPIYLRPSAAEEQWRRLGTGLLLECGQLAPRVDSSRLNSRSELTTLSGVADQHRDPVAEVRDLLLAFAEVGEQAQVVARDGAAGQQPGPYPEQLVELHELPVADEDAVLAHEHLDQPLELVEHLRREKYLTVVVLVIAAGPMTPRERHRQVAVCLDDVFERGMVLDPRFLVEALVHLRLQPQVNQVGEVVLLHRTALGLQAEAILQRRQLRLFGDLVGRGEQDAE